MNAAPTLSQMLQDLHRTNTAWQLDQFALLPSAATPWGLYQQILREVDTRRTAIRDSLMAEEAFRRGALWARLTLRPVRARGLAMAAQQAREASQEAARILAHLEARAQVVRRMLPEDLTPSVVRELDARDGCARLARSVAEARKHGMRPAVEVEQAIAALPAPLRDHVGDLSQGDVLEAERQHWQLDIHEGRGILPMPAHRAIEAAW